MARLNGREPKKPRWSRQRRGVRRLDPSASPRKGPACGRGSQRIATARPCRGRRTPGSRTRSPSPTRDPCGCSRRRAGREGPDSEAAHRDPPTACWSPEDGIGSPRSLDQLGEDVGQGRRQRPHVRRDREGQADGVTGSRIRVLADDEHGTSGGGRSKTRSTCGPAGSTTPGRATLLTQERAERLDRPGLPARAHGPSGIAPGRQGGRSPTRPTTAPAGGIPS